MKVTVRFVVIVALLALVCVPMQEANAQTIKQHVICRSVDTSTDSWEPVDITDEFTTADEKVMAFVWFTDIDPPFDTLTVWVGPDGTKVGETRYRVTEWYGMTAYRTLDIKGELPVGEWQHELYVDDKLVSTAKFALAPSVELVGKTFSHTENDVIYPGDIVTASYELKNTGRIGLRNVEIAVGDLPSGAKLTKSTAAKDLAPGETGKFVLELEFAKDGDFAIDVRPLVDKYLVETLAGTLTVSVSPLPIWQNPYVIAGIVAVVVLVLAVLLLMRRRRGTSTKPQTPGQVALPPASAVPLVAQPTAPQGATKYCIGCGAPIPAHALHCSQCGAAQQ